MTSENPLATLGTPKARREAFNAALVSSAESIQRAAKIMILMEQEGDDLAGISTNTIRMMRRIAAQQMLPEVFLQLGGRLRQRVAMLPAKMQRAIVDGTTVPLVIVGENNAFDLMQVDPRKLQPAQVTQVFDEGRMRDESEQRIWLEAMREEARGADGAALPRPDSITLSHRPRGIKVNGVFISESEMWRYLKELKTE